MPASIKKSNSKPIATIYFYSASFLQLSSSSNNKPGLTLSKILIHFIACSVSLIYKNKKSPGKNLSSIIVSTAKVKRK